jgi:hypothetical protein
VPIARDLTITLHHWVTGVDGTNDFDATQKRLAGMDSCQLRQRLRAAGGAVFFAAGLAVVVVARADFFALVGVAFSPADGARAVLAARGRALRAASATPSLASDAARRTPAARFRAVDVPGVEPFDFFVPTINDSRIARNTDSDAGKLVVGVVAVAV